MIWKYGVDLNTDDIISCLTVLTNQIYALLPNREEGHDWIKPLETIMEELAGMNRLFIGQHEIFVPLLSKLEGLFTLQEDEDFYLFRRVIFKCLKMIGELIQNVRNLKLQN